MTNRLLNILSWLGLVLVGAAVAIKFALPAREQYVNPLLIAGLACVLVYALMQWREVVRAFSGRQARYGTLTGVSVLVVLGILVAINYIGKRQNKRWDLTAGQQFSLSAQTRNVLTKLDAPLHIMVFANENEFQRYRDQLKEYEYASKQVTTEYVDPEKRPIVAQQNGIQQANTILFKYKDRTERTSTEGEQEITNAIIKAVTGQQKKVYFTLGHGEKDTASNERDGYKGIATSLTNENYTVETVVLAQQGGVPDDAAVLIVAGPKTDFLPGEIEALKKYLDKSGKLLLEFDPPDRPDRPALTNLIALAHDWGMEIGDNVVVDVSGMGRLIGASEAMPVAANYPSHPITEHFNLMSVFPLTRSVSPVNGGTNGHTAQAVVETSPQSWAESDVKGLFEGKPAAMDEAAGDKKGPVGIAAAVTATTASAPPAADPAADKDAPKPETRVVVYGDSDYPANATLGLPGNRDLFMNTVSWLSQQENLISIRPKEASDRRVAMTATQQSNIIWLSLVVIPGLIFGSGVYNWWRRR